MTQQYFFPEQELYGIFTIIVQICFTLQLQVFGRAGLTFHFLRAAASGKKIANSFSLARSIVAQARCVIIRAPFKHF